MESLNLAELVSIVRVFVSSVYVTLASGLCVCCTHQRLSNNSVSNFCASDTAVLVKAIDDSA